jgi:hypothetical protein
MKTIHRLFWTGLAVFLLSFLVGIFNISSDNAWSGIGLMGMLAGAALFLLCAVVLENDPYLRSGKSESSAVHAARCLHCAQGLNTSISLLLEQVKDATTRAHHKAAELNVGALHHCLAASAHMSGQLSQWQIHELARGYPSLLLQGKRDKELVTDLLRELSSYGKQCAELLSISQEVEAITRPTFQATGRWRTGAEVAGQFILASEVEPQQVTVVLAQALPITANQISAALKQLRAAQEIAPRCLDALSRSLTQLQTSN